MAKNVFPPNVATIKIFASFPPWDGRPFPCPQPECNPRVGVYARTCWFRSYNQHSPSILPNFKVILASLDENARLLIV